MNSLDIFFVSVLIKGFYRRRLQQRETQSLKASRWNLLRTAAVDHPLLPLKLHCSPPRGAQVLYITFSITLQREARQHEYFLECVCVCLTPLNATLVVQSSEGPSLIISCRLLSSVCSSETSARRIFRRCRCCRRRRRPFIVLSVSAESSSSAAAAAAGETRET